MDRSIRLSFGCLLLFECSLRWPVSTCLCLSPDMRFHPIFRYFKSPGADDFPVVAAVLRLSTKYLVERLRQRCLARLVLDWPSTVTAWDAREQAATDAVGHYVPRVPCPHPILIIDLALELNLPFLLPAAIYDLARYGPSRILAGTP